MVTGSSANNGYTLWAMKGGAPCSFLCKLGLSTLWKTTGRVAGNLLSLEDVAMGRMIPCVPLIISKSNAVYKLFEHLSLSGVFAVIQICKKKKSPN